MPPENDIEKIHWSYPPGKWTNVPNENRDLFKRKWIIFQPSIFRGQLLVFRGVDLLYFFFVTSFFSMFFFWHGQICKKQQKYVIIYNTLYICKIHTTYGSSLVTSVFGEPNFAHPINLWSFAGANWGCSRDWRGAGHRLKRPACIVSFNSRRVSTNGLCEKVIHNLNKTCEKWKNLIEDVCSFHRP